MPNQGQNKGGNRDETRGGSNRGSSERGFAGMTDEQQREIARKGGEAVSEDREHMSQIGRKGGEASGQSRSNQSGGEGGNR